MLTLTDPFATTLGTLVHRILEVLSQGEETPNWQQWLTHSDIEPTQQANAAKIIQQCISNTLTDPRGQWILKPHHVDAHSEWALSTLENDEIIHLVIDRSFIDEDGTRWIIDYKTSEQPQPEYQTQLDHYASAVQALDPERPIKLGLYFPASSKWYSWQFSATMEARSLSKGA